MLLGLGNLVSSSHVVLGCTDALGFLCLCILQETVVFLESENWHLRMISATLLSCGYDISFTFKAEMKMSLQYRTIVSMWLHGFNFCARFNLQQLFGALRCCISCVIRHNLKDTAFPGSPGVSLVLPFLGRAAPAPPRLAPQLSPCSLRKTQQLQTDWANSMGLKSLSSLCRGWSKAYSSMLKLCGLQFLLLIHSVSYGFSFVCLWTNGKGCLRASEL